jgi:transposase
VTSVFAVRDEVWEVAEPLLPVRPAQPTGRPRVSDRVAFNAIVFVLLTGIAWRHVPQELGCSGVTAWRRLRDWQQDGVRARLVARGYGSERRAAQRPTRDVRRRRLGRASRQGYASPGWTSPLS